MKKYLVLSFLLACCFVGRAYDFSAVAPTGQTLYYKITSASSHTVEVTPPCRSTHYPSWYGYTEPTGALDIPSSVSYGGNTYYVTSIGDYAFYVCYHLTSVSIPNSVTSIGEWSFYSCFCAVVTIPNSVTSIGNYAFHLVKVVNYCGSASGSPWGAEHAGCGFYEEDDFIYQDNTKTTLLAYVGSDSIVTIPNSVTSIGGRAFSGCSGLTSVTIPYSVTSIGDYAFENCGFMSVTIPNSVTTIGNSVFRGCSSLTSVTIPNSVTSIGESAFYGCSSLTSVTFNATNCTTMGSANSPVFSGCANLTSLTIGNNVSVIPGYAFYGCNGTLRTVYSLNPTAPTLGPSCFYGRPIQEIYIPCGSFNSYNSRWSGYSGYLEELIPLYDITLSSTNYTMGDVSLLTSVCADTSIISAIPNYGYHFTQWSDSVTDNPRTFVLTQDTAFTAEFERNSYAVTGVAGDASLGQVQGGGSFLYLDTIVLTATAVDHYHFTHWQDGNTENPRSIVVYSDSVFTAQFAIDTQHIVVVSSDINMGYVSGGGDIIYGQPVTVSATAYSGYHFSCWSNGSRYNPYTFAAIQDLTLSAVFVSDEAPFYTITVAANNAAMGHVEGSGTYDDGTVALITATPSEGCQFLHWSDGSTEAQHLVTISATATYTAYFAPESCSVTTETNDANAGVVSGDGIYYMGDTLSLTATANEGYSFTHWSDGSTDAVRSIVVDENLSANMQSLGGGAYGITFTAYFENSTEGIETVQKNYTLTVVGNAISICGAMGETVRVFDVVGRQLLTKKLDREEIRLNQTGVFFVQVGNAPAKKVVLVR